MRRTIITLVILLGIMVVVFARQWALVSSSLDPVRWGVVPPSEAPLLARELGPRVSAQNLVDGHAINELFIKMFAKGEGLDSLIRTVRTRIFVPGHAWGDVLFHDAEGRECAFRLSTSPGMPSGFLRRVDGVVESREDIEIGGTVVPADAMTPDMRQRLMIWSFNRPRESFDALVEEGHGRFFTVALSSTAAGVEASVDGTPVGVWGGVPEMHGPVGIQGGDLPPVFIDWFEVIDGSGEALWRDDFSPSVRAQTMALMDGLIGAVVWLMLWLATLLKARIHIPGADQRALAQRLAIGLWPLVVVPLLGWWWLTIERKSQLAILWLIAGALVILLWTIAFLSEREHFRWRVPAPGSGEPPRSARPLVIGGVLGAILVALPLGHFFLWPGVDRSAVSETLIDSPQILSAGSHVRGDLIVGRADLEITARIRLLDPRSQLEIYFLEAERDRFSPREAVRDWCALRLSDDPTLFGLLATDRPVRVVGNIAMPLGEEVEVNIRVEGSQISASLDGTVRDTLEDGRFDQGAIGFVVRAGRAEVSSMRVEGLSPESSQSQFLWPRFRQWRMLHRALYYPMALGAVLLLWALSTAVLARLGGFPARSLATFSALLWIGSLGVAVVVRLAFIKWTDKWPDLEAMGFSRGLVLWLPLCIAVVGHWLFWIFNFDHVRRRQLVSLLSLALFVITAEHVVRATPLNYALHGGKMIGHVRGLFAFGSWEREALWETYTGAYEMPHRFPGGTEPVPFEKPPHTVRIFAMGGSSTWGAGVATLENTYPEILEQILRGRGHTVEVFNAGRTGYTVFNDLLRLRADVMRLQPDIITLYVGANDGYLSWWTGGSQEEQWERRQRAMGVGFRERLSSWLANQRLFIAIPKMLQSLRPFDERLTIRVTLERYEANLREIVAICRSHGVDVVFAQEVMVEDLHVPNPSHAEYMALLARLAEELDVPIVDPHPIFAEHLDDGWLVDPVHPNAAGNRAIAEMLADVIEPLVQKRWKLEWVR